MKIIIHSPKYGDKEVLIDDEDWDKVRGYKWSIVCGGRNFYTITHSYKNNKRTSIKMHRVIMNINDKKVIDHINGNGLDNRRCNLRICENSENCKNRKMSKNNTSGCKGVAYNKKENKFVARIMSERNSYFLGYFINIEDAHKAYCEASEKYHGEYGRTA